MSQLLELEGLVNIQKRLLLICHICWMYIISSFYDACEPRRDFQDQAKGDMRRYRNHLHLQDHKTEYQ